MLYTFALAAAVSLVTAIIPFTTVDRGAQSQIEEPRTVVVRTAAEWAALWKEHAPGGQQPSVEFSHYIVLGVFAGTRSSAGYGVEVTSIESQDGRLIVRYREQEPGSNEMVAQVLTAPFHLVSTKPHSGSVTFERVM